jgi:hypothetical protein
MEGRKVADRFYWSYPSGSNLGSGFIKLIMAVATAAQITISVSIILRPHK